MLQKKHKKNLIISIRDNAGGFPNKIINAITEPYVTTKPSGTGLGLAIVKKIIDDHCGKIEFLNVGNCALVKVSLELYNDK